ncbi:MAG TPA: MogA/MoaB family molybdenum cofactor biosynthesis protein [Myxococcota bacterium]|nr:MogA/MoaB family molybdenum cofactor biosynthesis protein [Myxococcota bacterium]HRY96467.1 MogA/MoaB family molybdenum cofactor biosynthesis protein [Myxococcota bacterium]HSA22966.1 MogA/MoaB family molybdenum cofactor biosynthesis protein [Myxococcota bacterium]
MGHHEHREHAPRSVGVGLVTVSTSRSPAEDRSGPVMAELLQAAGHGVIERRLVQDGLEPVRRAVRELLALPGVQVVLLSGGTGITREDLTLQALEPLAELWLPGVGELFRQLSYAEIGTAAMLSRAAAAVCVAADGRRVLVVALPGSPAAVRLALEKVLLPELGHLVFELNR